MNSVYKTMFLSDLKRGTCEGVIFIDQAPVIYSLRIVFFHRQTFVFTKNNRFLNPKRFLSVHWLKVNLCGVTHIVTCEEKCEVFKVRLWVLMRYQTLTHQCIDILLIPKHILDHKLKSRAIHW